MTRVIRRLAMAAAALGLIVGASERAEALIVVEDLVASGTFADGATLGGDLIIAPDMGFVRGSELTITGGGFGAGNTVLFDTIIINSGTGFQEQGQYNANTYYVYLSAANGAELDLYIQATSLVGYTGGPLETQSGRRRPTSLPSTRT